jgi:hypothetical protein
MHFQLTVGFLENNPILNLGAGTLEEFLAKKLLRK